jgi:hypothetical protein
LFFWRLVDPHFLGLEHTPIRLLIFTPTVSADATTAAALDQVDVFVLETSAAVPTLYLGTGWTKEAKLKQGLA